VKSLFRFPAVQLSLPLEAMLLVIVIGGSEVGQYAPLIVLEDAG